MKIGDSLELIQFEDIITINIIFIIIINKVVIISIHKNYYHN